MFNFKAFHYSAWQVETKCETVSSVKTSAEKFNFFQLFIVFSDFLNSFDLKKKKKKKKKDFLKCL